MTIKQKLVALKLVENGGNLRKAMIAAGYSPATAKTPQKLTESKGWKEYIANHFYPDDEATLKILSNLLEATKMKRHTFNLSMKDDDIKGIFSGPGGFVLQEIVEYKTKKVAFYTMPDAMTQLKALDIIYRLKGYYSQESTEENSSPIDEALDKVSALLP